MNTLKIDIHSHLLPPAWPDFNGSRKLGFPTLEGDGSSRDIMIDGKFFRTVKSTSWDIEERIGLYEQSGVKVQVVCTVPVLFSYHLPIEPAARFAAFLNDHIAEVQDRHRDRVIALGTLPLQDAEASLKELDRFAELGLAGIQIGSNVNNRNMDDPELFRVFEACAEKSLAVLVHPWQMMGSEQMPKYWLPWLVGMPAELSRAICCMIFGGVLERLPGLRVCFAHGGGAFPFTIGRIEHGFNMRPDLVATDNSVNPREYIGKFWVDSVTHDPQALRYLIDVMGDDWVALGTDYPFPLGEQQPGSAIEALNPEAGLRDKLYFKNALRWLNLPESRFQP